jgi:DNA end-binding protein Ku
METMHYPDEIRSLQLVPNLPEQTTVNERELTMAKMLIEQLSTPFDPTKYTDDYRIGLQEAIQRKISGEGTDIVTAPAAEKTNVIDLMAALQASLEAVKPASAPAADPTDTSGGDRSKAKPRGTRGRKKEGAVP